MKLNLLLMGTITLAALVSCAPDDAPSKPLMADPVAARSSALSSTGKPGKCKLVKLPGTDPSAPTEYDCDKQKPASPKTPDPTLLAKQQQYLAKWKKQAATWSGLSEAQQEVKRRTLKNSVLGQGGQP
jgi:hypothetical protein